MNEQIENAIKKNNLYQIKEIVLKNPSLIAQYNIDINLTYVNETLITASLNRQIWSTVELLLGMGAITSKHDKNLIVVGAINTGCSSLFRVIKIHKINANRMEESLFFAALSFHHWDFVRYMICKGVKFNANHHKCDLDVLVKNGHWDLVRLLVSFGLSPNSRLKDADETLFQAACRAKHWKTIEYLALHDANVDLQNEYGETALHHAVLCGRSKTIKILLKCNADIAIQNNEGKTAGNLVEMSKNTHFKNKTHQLLGDLGAINAPKQHPRVFIVEQSRFLTPTLLKDQLLTQHANGLVALHMASNLNTIIKRLLHPIIINNIREDETGLRKSHPQYQFHPIISTTILPDSAKRKGQNLYTYAGNFFIIIDVAKTQIKSLSGVDAHCDYQKNKHGRPSYYRCGSSSFKGSFAETLSYVKEHNEQWNKRFFDLPTMNEMTVKVRAQSLLGIGTIASFVAESPENLLGLVYFQAEYKKHVNVHYPIYLYNNCYKTIKVPWVSKEIISILPNQFYEIDVNFTLKKLLKAFPNGLDLESRIPVLPGGSREHESIQELIKRVITDWHEREDPLVPNECDLYEKDLLNRKKHTLKINKILDKFSKLNSSFFCLHTLDNFVVNKKNKLGDSKFDFYPEINQKELHKFIKNNLLSVEESQTLNASEEEGLGLFTKCFNLIFRLIIYLKLMEYHDIINYERIREDFEWAAHLISLVIDRQPLRAPACVKPYNPSFWRNSLHSLKFLQNERLLSPCSL